jgi:hypothetical protein
MYGMIKYGRNTAPTKTSIYGYLRPQTVWNDSIDYRFQPSTIVYSDCNHRPGHRNLMIFNFLFLIRLKKELIVVVRISKQPLYKIQRDLENFFLRFLRFVLFVYEKNQIKIRINMKVDYSVLRILSCSEQKHNNILKNPSIYFCRDFSQHWYRYSVVIYRFTNLARILTWTQLKT